MPQDNPHASLSAQLRFIEELAATYAAGFPAMVAAGTMPKDRAAATIACTQAICHTIRLYQSITETGGPKSRPRMTKPKRANDFPLTLSFASEADRDDFASWVKAAGKVAP